MLWTFIVGFCVALAFIGSYIEEEKGKVILKDCPEGIVDPYECTKTHLLFLDVVRWCLIGFIPIYVIVMIASFHKILRMIQVMDNMIKPLR